MILKKFSSSDVTCPKGTTTTFIRIPKAAVTGTPSINSAVDLTTCAEHCRNNTEPTTGSQRSCQGFNYADSVNPSCDFFDDRARIGPINPNIGSHSYYYDKLCLSGQFFYTNFLCPNFLFHARVLWRPPPFLVPSPPPPLVVPPSPFIPPSS